MKLITGLLVIGCIAPLAPGQWLEKTIVLPDSLSGFGSPGTMLYNTGNNFLFVGCNNGVAIIDGFSNQLLARTSTGSLRDGVACYASQVNKLYWLSGSLVYVLDGATGRELRRITTPGGSDICYNPVVNRVYVTAFDTSGYVVIVNAANDSVVRTLRFEYAYRPWVACDPVDNKVYVQSYFGDTVFVVDCGMDSVIGAVPVGGASSQLVYGRVSNKLYCCGWFASVTVVDCSSDTVLRHVDLPGGVETAVYNPVANKLYCDDGEGICIIDGQGDTLLGRLQQTHVNAMVTDSADNLVWFSRSVSDTIFAIDGQGDTLCAEVAVGNRPWAMCYNPTRNRLYLEDGHLTVFDPAAREIEERVLLGFEPVAVCWAKSSHKIYCAGRSEAAVEVITIANQVLGPVPVGRDPVALAYDRPLGRVVCANNRDSTVSIIACNGDSVVGTVWVGRGPQSLCVDTILHKAWCGLTSGVAAVDLQAESLTAVIPVAYPGMLLADAARQRVYCATAYDARVVVLDAAGDSMVASIPVGGPAQALSLNPGANLVYCPTSDNDAVAVIDATTLRVVNIIPVGEYPAALFYNERRNKLYCANFGSDNVTAIDCDTETPVTTIEIHVSPSALAYDSVGDRLYCVSTNDNQVAVVDCQRDTMVKLIRVGSQPVAAACAFNFRRTYVANRYSSSLSVIRDSAHAGVEAPEDLLDAARPAPTVVRGLLMFEPANGAGRLATGVLLDISGRKVMDLVPGANDVRALAPGVYFARRPKTEDGRPAAEMSKVVVTR